MNRLYKGVVGVLVMILACGITAGVQASEELKKGPPAFADIDASGDGQVSEEEFNQFRAERMAARAAAGKKMKGAADAPSFADVDTDGNGYLDENELKAAQQAHMAKRQQNMQGHGKGYGQGEQGKGQGQGKGKGKGKGKSCKGKKGQMPVFDDFDVDENGSIDEQEFSKVHAERMSKMASEGRNLQHASKSPGFDGIDTNDDGQISPEELDAHQAGHCQKNAKQ